MNTNEEILVSLLKESLEDYVLEEPDTYKCRLPIEYSNHPILKAAADYGLIEVAATSRGTPETGFDKYLEIRLPGVRGVKEAMLGPDLIISNRLPADVWASFAGKVATAFGRPPDDIINNFLGVREGATPAASEDDQKFLIDDQAFSVAEEHKDVELPNNVQTSEEFVEVPVSEYALNHEYPLPSWASHRSSDLQLGSQLCTRDGRRCGNAVVAAVRINSHGGRVYEVITDVGNVIHAEACEVNEMFHPPEYVMKDEWVAEITERVKSDG